MTSAENINNKPIELKEFPTIRKGRPYIASNSVTTLDGYLSFSEPHTCGGREIGLGHTEQGKKGAGIDWHQLESGWAMSDAILGSGSILRAEPQVAWIPLQEKLIKWRLCTLKKRKTYPLNVVLTQSGCIDVKHPIFMKKRPIYHLIGNDTVEKYDETPLHCMIVTNAQGFLEIGKRLKQEKIESFHVTDTPHQMQFANTKVIAMAKQSEPVDIERLMKYLYAKKSVRRVEVVAGGQILGSMLFSKLIDEMRITLAAQLIGALSSKGEQRSALVEFEKGQYFTHETSPLLKYEMVQVVGGYHLFLRCSITYRHPMQVKSTKKLVATSSNLSSIDTNLVTESTNPLIPPSTIVCQELN